jgi:hypothetical protein
MYQPCAAAAPYDGQIDIDQARVLKMMVFTAGVCMVNQEEAGWMEVLFFSLLM